MASIFGHMTLGATLGKLLLPERRYVRYWVLAAACAFLPDIDVLGFKFHVAYASLWGHRGLTHSLLAAVMVASAVVGWHRLGHRAGPPLGRLWVLLFLATASHGVLDAMTTGGLGVAIFSPFVLERYFFGFCPIEVSPIGVRQFVGTTVWRVLQSEAIWVALPCAVLLTLQRLFSAQTAAVR
ncbi:metal-dependent hydrolase [Hymenobacter persicinus]|uniref:Metal-dependent hydrolase n=1 Tax=Hymenobacter persicinus TaxID=2025506 RepID=A0A4Q5L8R5_9BACT|nr:metal-dependent hydrolase [Hymenobacter persicinus]RYU78043.1 metal-dependent hydrolase [Hymenobacter persicinus]